VTVTVTVTVTVKLSLAPGTAAPDLHRISNHSMQWHMP